MWYEAYKNLFQNSVEEILNAVGETCDKSYTPRVIKRGSKQSTMFAVRYKNIHGVICGYKFTIVPSNAVGVYTRGTNPKAQSLMAKAKNLPPL